MVAFCDTLVFSVHELKGTPHEWIVREYPGGIINKLIISER